MCVILIGSEYLVKFPLQGPNHAWILVSYVSVAFVKSRVGGMCVKAISSLILKEQGLYYHSSVLLITGHVVRLNQLTKLLDCTKMQS